MDIFFIIIGCVGVLSLLACALAVLSFGLPILPFVPSSNMRIEALRKLSELKSGERVADIGSGDGRIVIALAKDGAIAHGFEINPLLVWWSRMQIQKRGLNDSATIYAKNFWHVDFSSYDVVVMYGNVSIMRRFEVFLRPQLKIGARVLVNGTPFPTWTPIGMSEGVSLYRK